jgi:hypothetical protein
MKVKIGTATVWEGVRREAGSVIEVPAEVYEKNSGWMKASDEPLKDAPAPKQSERQNGDQ